MAFKLINHPRDSQKLEEQKIAKRPPDKAMNGKFKTKNKVSFDTSLI